MTHRRWRWSWLISILSMLMLLMVACGGSQPEPVPEPEPTEAPAEPTEAPEPTEEPAPEPTEEPAPEPTEEPAPEPTEEPAPEPTEEPAPEPTEEPEAEPEEAAADEVTLRWRTRPDNQAEIDVYQGISDVLDDELANIGLTYEPGGSETSSYQDVLKTELAAGTAPDVFWIPGTDIADFATRGLIMDMREMADADSNHSDEDFYP
ncbi:MAG: extracellular solute-binding protein, partial [Ardenticatenaceae bacterium]